MSKIKCRYCNSLIEYRETANYMLFCPECKKPISLVCEYGFGPVTPCSVFLGNDAVAEIIKESDNYILKIYDYHNFKLPFLQKLNTKIIPLKSCYLDALMESKDVIYEFLNNTNVVKLDIIQKSNVNICVFNTWNGRPWDAVYTVKECFVFEDLIEIIFTSYDRIVIYNPSGIMNTEKEFIIQDADKIKWIVAAADAKHEILYEKKNGILYKNGKELIRISPQKPAFFMGLPLK